MREYDALWLAGTAAGEQQARLGPVAHLAVDGEQRDVGQRRVRAERTAPRGPIASALRRCTSRSGSSRTASSGADRSTRCRRHRTSSAGSRCRFQRSRPTWSRVSSPSAATAMTGCSAAMTMTGAIITTISTDMFHHCGPRVVFCAETRTGMVCALAFDRKSASRYSFQARMSTSPSPLTSLARSRSRRCRRRSPSTPTCRRSSPSWTSSSRSIGCCTGGGWRRTASPPPGPSSESACRSSLPRRGIRRVGSCWHSSSCAPPGCGWGRTRIPSRSRASRPRGGAARRFTRAVM